MKESLRRGIKALSDQIGVSGYEWDVAKYIYNEIKYYVDDIELKANGNLIAKVFGKNKGPKVVYSSHLDEVGYVIKSVSKDGYLYFGKIGGSSDNILPGRKVIVKGEKGIVKGVIGTRSTHMLSDEQMKKMQSVQESYVDICAESREQVEEWGIKTGCQMVIESPCSELFNTDYLVTKSADCRALCAILVDAIKRINKDEVNGELYFVFTAMEEVTTAGIKAAVNYIKPDYCFIFDTVPSGDVPDVREVDNPLVLNGGAAIITVQHNKRFTNYACAHPKLLEAVRNISDNLNIKTQEFAFVGAFYSNDGSGAINAGDGNAILSIALPRRYSHSPTEVISLNDCVEIEKLILELFKTNIGINMI